MKSHSKEIKIAMQLISNLLEFHTHLKSELIVKSTSERITVSPMIIGDQFNHASEFVHIVEAVKGLSFYIHMVQLPIVADQPYGATLPHIELVIF